MDILRVLASFGILMLAVSVHEFAHAFTAYKLGDTTAKYSGRLTLNPLAHIDPIGTIVMPLLFLITIGIPIGSAKPVPINYSALKNPKKGIILIGLSGPLANFIFALFLSALYRIIALPLIINLIVINLVLGIFNLIPIPPLDGSRILMGLLPANLISPRYAIFEPLGFILLIILIRMGMFERIILPVLILIFNWLRIPLAF